MAKEAKKSALDTIKELNAQVEELKAEAKEEALLQANEAIELLNSLGFSYYLGNNDAKKPSKAGKGQRKSAEGPCQICKFTTNPPHDGRKHRNQGEHKKPFTQQELSELGFEKVG